MDKWKSLCSEGEIEEKDVYIGGTCALRYALYFEDYVKELESEDSISIFFVVNSSGCDKKKLAVIGKEELHAVSSIPVKYYRQDEPFVTGTVIQRYLSQWNDKLKCSGRNIKLLTAFPENVINKFNFSNIKIDNLPEKEFIAKTEEKITKCFKFHYRKLQIIKKIVCNEPKQIVFLDYINIVSAAWHNVSSSYIYNIFNPTNEGMFNIEDDDEELSLAQWCEQYNVPIAIKSDANMLDKFISCDDEMPSANFDEDHTNSQSTNEVDMNEISSTSAIEAYQAMMRLVSYLQGEGATLATMKSAKLLEEYFSNRALAEVQQIYDKSNGFKYDE